MENKRGNARATRMAESRALFDQLSPLARQSWTIERIASWCGVSIPTVNRWFGQSRGRRSFPNLDSAVRTCRRSRAGLAVAGNRQTASMDNDTFDLRTLASLPIQGVRHVGHAALLVGLQSSTWQNIIRRSSTGRASS
jgi:hypothetical protein